VHSSQQKKAADLVHLVGGGNRYASFNDPYETWASWRSAWLRGDAQAVYRTYSAGMKRRESGALGDRGYVQLLDRQLKENKKDRMREIANNFRKPVILHLPGKKPGDLAVFKSEPMMMKEIAVSKPQVWVLAMTWD